MSEIDLPIQHFKSKFLVVTNFIKPSIPSQCSSCGQNSTELSYDLLEFQKKEVQIFIKTVSRTFKDVHTLNQTLVHNFLKEYRGDFNVSFPLCPSCVQIQREILKKNNFLNSIFKIGEYLFIASVIAVLASVGFSSWILFIIAISIGIPNFVLFIFLKNKFTDLPVNWRTDTYENKENMPFLDYIEWWFTNKIYAEAFRTKNEALTKLANHDSLVYWAKEHKVECVRKAIVENLADQTVLADIAKNDISKDVRSAAKNRLEELTKK